jgi:hypothetical protein
VKEPVRAVVRYFLEQCCTWRKLAGWKEEDTGRVPQAMKTREIIDVHR